MYRNTITPQEAKAMLDKRDDIIVIDVRNEGEYRQGHIPGSKLIPLQNLKINIEYEVPDKSSTIFIYCQGGSRSKIAYEYLKELGYENVYNMGGIIYWPYKIQI